MVATSTFFCLNAFSIILCSVILAFSHWKHLPLPFSLCLFFPHPPLLFYHPFCPPRPPDAPPSVPALLAVSITLSGLAAEKRQPAGGGPGLPVCVATLLSHWHQHQVLLWLSVGIPFREDNEEEERAGWGVSPVWISSQLGQRGSYHMDSMDHVVFTVLQSTKRLHKS